jgi:hypothetical protein
MSVVARAVDSGGAARAAPPLFRLSLILTKWLDGVGDRESLDLCTPETARHACEALGLMFEERGFLAEQGVDWRLYDRHELD